MTILQQYVDPVNAKEILVTLHLVLIQAFLKGKNRTAFRAFDSCFFGRTRTAKHKNGQGRQGYNHTEPFLP